MSFTFELGTVITPNLRVESGPIIHGKVSAQENILNICGQRLEQAYEYSGDIIDRHYAPPNLVGLAHYAFAQHRHMILDPDMIWVTIERGLAAHILENAEELRSQFVSFKGKVFIELQRDHFVRGAKNDWEGCFDEFSEKIGGYIGKKKDLIVSNFSTTDMLRRVSSEIILMDAMSKYFDYGVSTCCSIPSVTLEGTPEDWEKIKDKVFAISEFNLSWWTDHLIPIVDELIRTSKGKPDLEFWKSWYKENGGSGGPFITGHVNKFFPYLDTHQGIVKNTFESHHGPTLNKYLKGFSKVPFGWKYYGTTYPMEFIGGVIGIEATSTGGVRGAFGWAVKDEAVPLINFPLEYMVKGMEIHSKNDVGKLKVAKVEEWGPGDRSLCEVQIEWEKGGLQTHNRWNLNEFYVKSPVIDP